MPTAGTLRMASLLLALAWAGVIWFLSAQSTLPVPAVFEAQDKLLHIIAYSVLGFLAMGSRPLETPPPASRGYWMVCAVCVLYGVVDEIHQSYVPGRNPDVLDVVADSIGVLLGAWLLHFLVQRSKQLQN